MDLSPSHQDFAVLLGGKPTVRQIFHQSQIFHQARSRSIFKGRIMLNVRIALVLGLLVVASAGLAWAGAETTPAVSNDSAASPSDDASAPVVDAAEKEAAKADFDKVFTDWKMLIGRLAGLNFKYTTANAEKQLEIQQQWNDLTVEGKQMERRLIAAAERAYAAAPNEDKAITEFLVKLVGTGMTNDDYELAARIGKLLMKNHCKVNGLATQVGVACLMISDFTSAEDFLLLAQKNKEKITTDKEAIDGLVNMFVHKPEYFHAIWAREKQIRENEDVADNLPRVLLRTSKGDVVVELFENEAPLTVANFIYLVKRKFYDGLPFHRVIANFMAQGGDPKGDGTGGPGYKIPCECYQANLRHHFRGSLSMAKANTGGNDGKGRDTGGSQFFITFVPSPGLDGVHTVFGRVVSGMDAVAKLQCRTPDDKEAQPADKILEAKVLRDRGHDYTPKKLFD
jgi:cyclophilin family peptidyl-prolyl cis-trans isomerase